MSSSPASAGAPPRSSWTPSCGPSSSAPGRPPRRPLTWDEIRSNAETYKAQLGKVLDMSRAQVRFNSEWLGPLTFEHVIRETAHLTVARILQREDFAARHAAGRPISLHEFLYPLAQGYDSVALGADVELGGTDQTFNLLVGRDLQRAHGQEPQVALTMPILEGLDGVQKMSKSLGNFVGITEPAADMYGKLMSVSDALMFRYFELVTRVPEDEIARLRGLHPMEASDLVLRHASHQLEVAEHQRVRDRHQLAVHVGRRLGDPHVVAEALRHLLHAVQAFEDRHGECDLRLLAMRALEITAHEQVERLVGAAQLHVGAERDRIVALGERVEELVEADRPARCVASGKILALQDARHRQVGGLANDVLEGERAEPLRVEPHLRAAHVEHLPELRLVRLGVAADLVPRERAARLQAAGG